MIELLDSILSDLTTRYIISIILNVICLTYVWWTLDHTLAETKLAYRKPKVVDRIRVVLGIVIVIVCFELLYQIGTVIYVFEELKGVFELLIYETGIKSV